MWSEKERRANAISIMRGNIDRDDLGSKLTESAKQSAAEFAADAWTGSMGNSDAAQIGIKHVTAHIIKGDR